MTERGMIDDAVAGFGRCLGLPHWALDVQGRAAVRLQSGAALAVELQDDGQLLLLLERPVARAAPELLQRALEATHFRHGLPLQLGLRGSGAEQALTAATRLDWRQASPSVLARRFDQMFDWFEQLEQLGHPAAGAHA